MVGHTLSGDGVRTQVVCGYNPCYNNKTDNSTTYQKHRRYFRVRNKNQCPRTLFRKNLISTLSKWREEGDRLIVCLDANKHIYKKSIGKALTDGDSLAMKEVVGEFTGTPIGSTFFRGLKPIDGVWATSDIAVCNAAIMPAGFGIGDHRLFVMPVSRHLNTKLPGVANRFTSKLEEMILKH